MLRRVVLLGALTLATVQPCFSGEVNANWEALGPEGGPLGPFLFSQEDASLIFAASGNGVFRSRDGGASWERTAVGLTDPNIDSLARSGTDLLAGTLHHGLFRSGDQGDHWVPSGSGLEGQSVSGLAASPLDQQRVFAAIPGLGVFRSADGGKTFVASNEGLDDLSVTEVAVSPIDADTVFCLSDSAVFRSQDGGVSWTNVTFNLPIDSPLETVAETAPHRLAVNPRGEALVALPSSPFLLRGQDWFLLYIPFLPITFESRAALASNPSNPEEILFEMGDTLLRTRDEGAVWETISVANLKTLSSRGLAYHPLVADTIFVGASGGTFVTDDSGQTWRETTHGLRADSVASLGIDPQNPLVLYATGLGGAWKTTCRNRWIPIRGELGGLATSSFAGDAHDPNTLFVVTMEGVHRSRDAGLHWDLHQLEFEPVVATHPTLAGVVMTRVAPRGIGFSMARILLSRDSGDTWEDVTGEITSPVTHIFFSRTNPNRVWLATSTGVYYSPQLGGDWREVNEGLLDTAITSLEEDANGAVLAGTSSGRIFRQSDPEGPWTELTSPSSLAVEGLAASPRSADVLYAATDGEGLFESQDGGQVWTRVPGVENPYLREVRYSRDGRRLYAVGNGGVYELSLEASADLGTRIEQGFSGNAFPRGLVTLTTKLIPPEDSEPGVYRFQQALPPGLRLVEARADVGDAFVGPAFDSVTWIGSLDADATLEIRAEVLDGTVGRELPTQGVLFREDDPLGPRSVSDDASNPASAATVVTVTDTPFRPDVLAVPRSLGIDDTFVGFALLNRSFTFAQVEFESLRADGEVAASLQSDRFLGFNAQLTGLAGNLVDTGQTLLMESSEAELEGFFLLGDYQLERLDGVGGAPMDSQRLFLPRIQRSGQRQTFVFLFNPDPNSAVAMTLDLRATGGEPLQTKQAVVPPHGSIWASAAEIFPGLEEIDGYLRVEADHPLRGFELVAGDRTFESLSALQTPHVNRLWAPHVFFGDELGTTRLRLLNTGRHDLDVTVRMNDDSHGLLGTPTLRLAAGELRVVDLPALFPSGGERREGWLRVDAATIDSPVPEPPGLFAAVEYEVNGGTSASTLPLQAQRLQSPHFLHVAQSKSRGIFQGLALLDLGPDPSFGLFSLGGFIGYSSGGFPSNIAVPRSFGTRLSGLLDDPSIFGAGYEQSGGHIEVLTPSPLFAYAIFGGGRFLSAIEAQGSTLDLY